MKTATENTSVDISHWVPGARFFSGSDGKHFIIDADLTVYPEGPTNFIRRQTAVLYCSDQGVVEDMVPDHLYPPGTTPEAALAELGYTF